MLTSNEEPRYKTKAIQAAPNNPNVKRNFRKVIHAPTVFLGQEIPEDTFTDAAKKPFLTAQLSQSKMT